MASKLEIWNLALGNLGNKAGLSSASPPYDTREGELCGMYYDLARKFAISYVKPFWAKGRVVLAEVTDDLGDDMPVTWGYAYAKPNATQILGIFDPGSIQDEDAKGYEYETHDGDPVIYTNVNEAIARVLIDVEDVDKFHPAFVVGLASLLAAYIAGPLIKGKDGMAVAEAWEKKALGYLGQAAADSANQSSRSEVRDETRHLPSFIAARGFMTTQLETPIIRDEN